MKIVTIVPPSPLLPAAGPIPPREAGKLTAAVSTPPEPLQLRSSPYPAREVKTRQSFAGGFQFPRQYAEPASAATKYEDLNERAQGHETTWEVSGNAIDSLEAQVARLQLESESLRPRSHRGRIESLLHLDSLDVYRNHHHHSTLQTEMPMSLEQLEFLRTEHAKRLTEVEAEYARSRKEGAVWSSSQLDFRSYGRSALSKVSKSEPKVPTELRQRYESRFEEYLMKKRGSTQPVQQSSPSSLHLEPFLSYIFKQIDKDRTGRIDKLELMQEIHQNQELARLLGFEAVARDPDYMGKFEQLFSSLGDGNEVSFTQFLAFFSS